MLKRAGDMLSTLVIVAGALVLLYPTISNYLAEQNSSRAVDAYEVAVESLSDQAYDQMIDDARAYNAQLAGLSGIGPEAGGADPATIDADALREAYDGLLNLSGDGMMGYITIPRLKETMPIYHTVEEKVLQVGVGHIETGSLPVGGVSTHASLSGHRGLPSAKLFTELDKMVPGDVFYIRILKETFAYRVDAIETVLPTQTEPLQIAAGKDLVTLVTCTPYGINSHRLLVHASAIPYVPEEAADVVGKRWGFVNIPLPYAMLMAGLAVLAVIVGTMRRSARGKKQERGLRGGAHFA